MDNHKITMLWQSATSSASLQMFIFCLQYVYKHLSRSLLTKGISSCKYLIIDNFR